MVEILIGHLEKVILPTGLFFPKIAESLMEDLKQGFTAMEFDSDFLNGHVAAILLVDFAIVVPIRYFPFSNNHT
jgi:hypothetical protein